MKLKKEMLILFVVLSFTAFFCSSSIEAASCATEKEQDESSFCPPPAIDGAQRAKEKGENSTTIVLKEFLIDFGLDKD